MLRPAYAPVVLLALGLFATSPADGQVSFQRIIGTFDPLPGAPPGTTVNIPFEAVAAGEWIAFGSTSQIGRGVYAWDGHTVHKVVDELTPVPGGTPTIIPFPDDGYMDLGADGSVVLLGGNQTGHGVWRWEPGGLIEPLVESGDPSPTAPGETVVAVDRPRVWGPTAYIMVARSGVAPYSLEIIGFPADGPAFRATPQDFQVMTPAFDATSQLLYRAFDTNLLGGLWRGEPGEMPELLLAPGDPLPGGLPGETWIGAVGDLLRFGVGGAVVGGGGTLGTLGFFAVTGPGVGHALIRHGDPEPGTGMPIHQLPGTFASSSENRFAFIAELIDNSSHLSVREPDGSFLPILSTGDVLEGEVVTDIWISTKAFAGDDRLVAVIHRQTEAAIWTIHLPPLGGPSPAEIPTSSTAGFLLLALALGVGGCFALERKGRDAPNRLAQDA